MNRLSLLLISAFLVSSQIGYAVTVTPETVTFPKTLAVGETDLQVVTVSNDTNAPVQLIGITLEPASNHPQFSPEGGTCIVGGGLEAHQKCTIKIRFVAKRVGPEKKVLTITTLTGSLASPTRTADWADVEGRVQ